MNFIAKTFSYCRKYLGSWILFITLGIIVIGSYTLIPLVPQLIIDRVVDPALGAEVDPTKGNLFSFVIAGFAVDDYWDIFFALCGVMFVLLVAYHGTRWWRGVQEIRIGKLFSKELRNRVYNKIMRGNSVTMQKYTSGDLMTILNGDTESVGDIFAVEIPLLFDIAILIIFAVVFLSEISWYLIIVPTVLGIVTTLFTFKFTRMLMKSYALIRDRSIDLTTRVQENISGVRIIRAFSTEELELAKFDKSNAAYCDELVNHTKRVARYNVGFSFLAQAVNFLSIIVGIWLAVEGNISLGEFSTFLSYVTMINGNIVSITNTVGTMQRAVVSGNRLFEFLDMPDGVEHSKNPLSFEGKPNISVSHASLSFGTQKVLDDVTVEIPYGKKIGVMGETGGGKSVFLKTLLRIFDVTEGEITINGVNVKDLEVGDVRRVYSPVLQEVFLFSNTIDANVAFYDPDAARESVEKACKEASAHDFICKMPDKYDTIVGERGVGLSGGQRQRISLARALLKNTDVFVFDDCTSALDLETERKIMAAINEEYSEKSQIIISHRARSVKNCDEILYFSNGKIIERGTHDELMALKGEYYGVYTDQESKNLEEIEG